MRVLLMSALLWASGGATFAAGCNDTSVAELQLLEKKELQSEYCIADCKRQSKLDGYNSAIEKGFLDLAEDYSKGAAFCEQMTTRIARVLRAKYASEPPKCDGCGPLQAEHHAPAKTARKQHAGSTDRR